MSESNTPWDTSVYTRWNPPGQKELTYRAGTYTTVLQRLLAALADQNTHQGINVPPLNTDPQDNLSLIHI